MARKMSLVIFYATKFLEELKDAHGPETPPPSSPWHDDEVLDAPDVVNMIEDAKEAEEKVRAINDFLDTLANDPDRACCGLRHDEVAHERLAILIADDLLSNAYPKTREKCVSLVESVKVSGGTVHTLSSIHVPGKGEQFAWLAGIAEILRFPLPDLGN